MAEIAPLKALTLTQPWASLVALREKTIETRSWQTSYRGELVIHAAKGFPKLDQELCLREPFRSALRFQAPSDLPRSVGLCVVRLLGCVKTTDLHKAEFLMGKRPPVKEIPFGNYAEGRYAWCLEYLRPLDCPDPVRGALSLWDWPYLLQAEVR